MAYWCASSPVPTRSLLIETRNLKIWRSYLIWGKSRKIIILPVLLCVVNIGISFSPLLGRRSWRRHFIALHLVGQLELVENLNQGAIPAYPFFIIQIPSSTPPSPDISKSLANIAYITCAVDLNAALTNLVLTALLGTYFPILISDRESQWLCPITKEVEYFI